jgi:hypothetical protein
LGAELTRLSLHAVGARLPRLAVRAWLARRGELTRLALEAVRARLALRAELTRLPLLVIRARVPRHAVRARLALGAELTRCALKVRWTRLPLRIKRARLPLRAKLTRLRLRAGRALHAVRAGVSLGTVRTGLLPLRTIAARPGGSAGSGVSGCRRMSARGRMAGVCDEAGQTAAQRIAAEVVAAGRQVRTGRETGHRPGPSGHRPARARETALTRERTRAGKGAADRGTALTRECAVGGEVSAAAERPRRCIRVLRRTWSVTVRRCAVSRAAARRSVGGPPSSGGPWRTALAAFRRDDQAAGRVDGRWGEDSLAIGVNNVNRPGAAVRDAVAVERALSLIRGTRVRGGRTRVRSVRAVGLS